MERDFKRGALIYITPLQEEPMEGCADGTWKGVRYFNCRQGQGFFCPLSSLVPDQRFAQTTTGGGINRELGAGEKLGAWVDSIAFTHQYDSTILHILLFPL